MRSQVAVRAVALFVGYATLSLLGLRWATVQGAASPVWPPAGLALAALALWGVRLWPAITAGMLAAYLADGRLPPPAALAIGLGDALAAAGGARALSRLGFRPSLTRLRDGLALFAAAGLSAAFAATMGTAVLAAMPAPGDVTAATWAAWVAGNFTGILICGPPLLAWAGAPPERSPRWWAHLVASTIATAAVAWGALGPSATPFLRTFVVFPPLAWAGLAAGSRGVSVALLPVSAIALVAVGAGGGPFATFGPADSVLQLQLFLAVVAITTLLLAVVSDERRQHEELAATRLRLQAVMDAVPLGIAFSLDREAHRVTGNATLAAQFHTRTADDLSATATDAAAVGRSIRYFRDGLPVPGEALPLQRAARDGVTTRQEAYEVELPDGARWVADISAAPVRDATGEAIGAVVVVADVTTRVHAEEALRGSEQRLQALADHLSQLAWMADGEGEIFWYNQRWFDYTGTTLDEVRGWGWRRCHHPEHVDRVVEKIRDCFRRGVPWEDTFPLRSAAGEYRWFLSRAMPIHDAQGRVTRWIGTNTDITNQREADAERVLLLESERAARSEAEHASRLKDEFLATVSHELRTPLNAILGWTQILVRRRDDASLAEGLAVIERNARAQARLIDELLDMSRIISGKVRLDLQPVDLREVVLGALASIRPAADARGIHLDAPAGPPVSMVAGDPHRLQQVVWNLLSNAVKFTPVGGTVRAALDQVDAWVRLRVTDTGQGISADFLPYVFERFRQGDMSTTRRHGGLGLGLAIVRQLVELHHGQVRAESEGAGRGATFVVELPPAASMGASTQPVSAGQSSLEGLVVLAVDDQIDSLSLLRRVLEDRGARVAVVASAVEALERLRHDAPDVLISDIGMPDVDGVQFIARLRQLPPQLARLPAVALSAFARPEDRARALSAGFDAYLTKPLHADQLVATVATLAARVNAPPEGGGREPSQPAR